MRRWCTIVLGAGSGALLVLSVALLLVSAASAQEVGQPAGWTPYENISHNSGRSEYPAMAVDSSGTLHVVWEDDTSGNDEIYYATKPRGGFWSVPVTISDSSGQSRLPAVAVSSDGAVHVVWWDWDWSLDSEEIYYASKASGGGWSSPVNISYDSGQPLPPPAVAVSSDGAVHVVWRDWSPVNDEIYYASKASGGSWSSPVNISNSSEDSFSAAIAVDSVDALHAVWSEDIPGTDWIYYATKPGQGDWAVPVRALDTGGFFDAGYKLAFAVDGSDGLHVAWPVSDVFYSSKLGGVSSWSAPVQVSNSSYFTRNPAITADGSGTVHLVWEDKVYDYWIDILYAMKPSGGSWSEPINLSDNWLFSLAPAIVADGDGSLHVVWADVAEGNGDIFYITRPAIAIPINAGWTTIGGLWPNGTYTASSMAQSMIEQGIQVQEIARWHGGTWESYLVEFPVIDFDIQFAAGYFVRSTNSGTWIAPGP